MFLESWTMARLRTQAGKSLGVVSELLKKRISTRAFLDKDVSRAQLVSLLEAARWSPSGGNLQPWKVIAVSGEPRDRVVALAQAAIMANPQGEAGDYPIYPRPLDEPYRSRRFKVGEDMYEKLGIGREDKSSRLLWVARNYEFFGAPAGLFFVLDRNMGHGQWAHLGMFMQSLALAAEDAGLATCMQEAWGMLRDTLHKHFELAEQEMIYCGMALGYADPDAPVNSLRSDRAELGEFCRIEGFD